MNIVFGNSSVTVESWSLCESREWKSIDPVSTIEDDFEDLSDSYQVMTFNSTQNSPLGKLLISFLGFDFSEKDQFIDFINIWGLSGFEAYSNTAAQVDELCRLYTESEYHQIIDSIWNEAKNLLIHDQNILKELVYICLCEKGPAWTTKLTPTQRFWVIMNCTDVSLPEINSFEDQLSYHYRFGPNTIKSDDLNTVLDLKKCAKYVKSIDIEKKNIAASKSISAISFAEFKELVSAQKHVKKCNFCGRFFIPSNRSDTEYCDWVIKTTEDGEIRTCKNVGPLKKYINKVNNDPIKSAYIKAYKSIYAKTFYRNRENRISKDIYELWKKDAQLKINLVKKGELSFNEFEKWLKEGC